MVTCCATSVRSPRAAPTPGHSTRSSTASAAPRADTTPPLSPAPVCQPPIARYISQPIRSLHFRTKCSNFLRTKTSLRACAGSCAAALPRPHARGTARRGPEGTRRVCARRPPRWGCGAPPPTTACLHHTTSRLGQLLRLLCAKEEDRVRLLTASVQRKRKEGGKMQRGVCGTVRGELDGVSLPALSRPVPIRPVQRPAVMERHLSTTISLAS